MHRAGRYIGTTSHPSPAWSNPTGLLFAAIGSKCDAVRTRNWIALAACVAILLGAIWIVAEVTSGPAAHVIGALASIVGGGALIGALIFLGELWLTRNGPPSS